ncbi:alpha/beta fold hydrolase [Spirillospora sp. NPDC048824]|uniref:alpha/beta fold hydrolase n=1 Tax=Spirillospora sp. NPDC048824 TaxID=3364526 RepID=UPI003715438C
MLGKTYRSRSGEVRWDVHGDEHADPVVLLHGTPFSSYVWRGVARALATTHRVYVWDMPGYGTSEMSAGQDPATAPSPLSTPSRSPRGGRRSSVWSGPPTPGSPPPRATNSPPSSPVRASR